MIFRQLFDNVSCTYTYLLAGRPGGEALIIDPVVERLDRYLKLIDELGVRLVKAVDTHVHADHISALAALRDATRCVTVMGAMSKVDRVSMRVEDGDTIEIDGLALGVLYTPGHTDDSYCFTLADRVFTGDTLLIRGTGRTDFQNGDARQAYSSIFDKLLALPDDTLVYPGHDYKGDTVSTIGEERRFNPRLRVTSADAYAAIMDNLGLPNPKLMDVAVPANLKVGLVQSTPELAGSTVTVDEARRRVAAGEVILVDLRESPERARRGSIPGSVHVPYQKLGDFIKPGGTLAAFARGGKPVLLYCAFGERSALALGEMQRAGLTGALHLAGGIDAWINFGGAVDSVDS